MRPVSLMLLCSIVFAFTDIHITRSLKHIDSYNFMVCYNLILALCPLAVVPRLEQKKVTLLLTGRDLWWSFLSAVGHYDLRLQV